MLDDNDTSLRPARPTNLAEQVYQSILSDITNGRYEPNTKLPSEHQLAETFSVSRPVVRAALARLKDESVIISRQGAGSFVHLPQTARALGFQPVANIADIQRCYEYRLTIEPDIAHHAALRHNEEALHRIAMALETLRQATRQGVHRDDADFSFHMAIAEASNNHYYRQSLLALQAHISVGMHTHGISVTGPGAGLAGVLAEHQRIYDAIHGRLAEAAHQAMAAHLRSSRDRLFEGRLLDLSLRSPPSPS